MRKIVAEQVRMMGGVPYRRYVFVLHGSNGGLEHLNSTAITSSAARSLRDRWLSPS